MLSNEQIEKAVCSLSCGTQKGSAFLIDSDIAVTAYHCIKESISEKKYIALVFRNIKIEPIPVEAEILNYDPDLDVAILKLKDKILDISYLKLVSSRIIYGSSWYTFGYPTTNFIFGSPYEGKVLRANFKNTPNWDVDLYSPMFKPGLDLKGLSGSPLIILGNVLGIINTKLEGRAFAVSIKKIQGFLDVNQIKYETKFVDEPKSLDLNLFTTLKNEITSFIDSYEYKKAEEKIEFILQTYIFPTKTAEAEILLLLGSCKHKMNKMEESKVLINLLDDLELENKEINKYKIKVASLIKDDDLYNKYLFEFKETLDLEEFHLVEVEHLYFKQDFKEIINYSENNSLIKKFNNDRFLFYLGFAYLHEDSDQEKGRNYLKQSYELKDDGITLYFIAQSIFIPILQNDNAPFADKQILKEAYNDLLKIELCIKDRPQLIEPYWSHRLSILQLSNPEEIINTKDLLPEELKDKYDFQLILAKAYFFTKNFDKLGEMAEAIHNKYNDFDSLHLFLLSLIEKENYKKIVEYVESKPNFLDLNEENERIITIYLNAVYKFKGILEVFIKFAKYKDKLKKYSLLFSQFIEFKFLDKKIEEAKELISEFHEIVSASDKTRFSLAKSLSVNHFYDEAIMIIEPFQKIVPGCKKLLLKAYVCSGVAANLNKAVTIVEATDPLNESYKFLEWSLYTYGLKKNYKKLYNLSLKAFHKYKELRLASSVLTSSLYIRDFERFPVPFEIIEFLSQSNDAGHLMMISTYYKLMNNKRLTDNFSYRSFSLLGDEFDEEVYGQYVRNNLFFISEGENVLYENVVYDAVITLKSKDGREKLIFLDDQINLFEKEPKHFLGIEYYGKENQIALELKNEKSCSSIKLNDEVYEITRIVNKDSYIFWYCFNIYLDKCPNSDFVWKKNIDKDDPIKDILPILYSGKKDKERLRKHYNDSYFKGKGLPIYTLTRNNILEYLSALGSLWGQEDQIFFAGEIKNYNLKNKKIVMTLSSLILLNLLELIDLLEVHFLSNIVISRSLFTTIKLIYEDADRDYESKAESKSAGVDEFSRIVTTDNTKEKKQLFFTFWKKLLLFCKKVTVIDVEIKNDHLLDELTGFCGEFEISSLQLVEQLDGVLISDDLFVRRVGNLCFGEIKTTNSISIIKELLQYDLSKLLDKLIELSKFNYFMVLEENLLIKIINNIDSNLTGPGTKLDKLEKFLNNSLSEPRFFIPYGKIIKNVFKYLEEEYFVETLIHKEIKKIFNRAYKNNINKIIPDLRKK